MTSNKCAKWRAIVHPELQKWFEVLICFLRRTACCECPSFVLLLGHATLSHPLVATLLNISWCCHPVQLVLRNRYVLLLPVASQKFELNTLSLISLSSCLQLHYVCYHSHHGLARTGCNLFCICVVRHASSILSTLPTLHTVSLLS